MPRIPHSTLRQAAALHPHLPALLRPCRNLDSAKNELRWLREHALSVSKRGNGHDESAWVSHYRLMCEERARGKPLQYIVGNQPFGDLEILCQPGVLIPRPETESITSHLASVLSWPDHQRPKLRLLDLCSGTGCISLLLHAILASRGVSSQVIGVDAAPLAVKLARRNLQHNHGNGLLTQDAHDDIAFLNADIFEDDFMTKTEEYYDVLVSNPPYISLQAFATTTSRSVRNFEPRAALVPSRQSSTTAHQDGGDIFYPRLLSIAHEIQAKILLVEVADLEQAKRVAGLVVENPRWHGCEIWRDWPAQSSHANVHEVVIRGRTLNLRGDGNGRAVFAWTQDGQDLLKTRR